MSKRARKAPAFQYYPDDFEQGTASFTLEQVGAYQRLLNYQWATGAVPGDDLRALSRILRSNLKTTGFIWRVISTKFVRNGDGRFKNPRLEIERKKQLEFARKQARNGRKGGRPPKNPGLFFGLSNSKPNPKPKKSSPSPSVEIKDQPPNPLRVAKGDVVEVSQKPPTRSEREFAEHLRTQRSTAHQSACPHDPPCEVSVTCIGRIVQEKRLFEAHGQRRALGEVS